MTGRTLLHYNIIEKLGEGGMGVVWKARDTHLDRFVALKTLPAEKLADPERKRRFAQEAKAASALNHPNIVHIYDITEADGVPFIAMEYVAGKTLDQLIGRKGLRLNETLKYAVQIADALAAAHAAGIVHRDLKPSNVIVNESGLVKILDFGLAKLTEAAPYDESDATRTLGLTEEGTIVGTASYMSPEQAEGKLVGARSDIFAFGSVLYEMLTSHRAFQRDTRASTVAAILRDDPKPPSQFVEDLPGEIERILKRCLRKDPAQRFQHMDDLKVALEELKEETGTGKVSLPALPQRPRPNYWMAALTIVLALTAAGAWWFAFRGERVTAAYGPIRPLTTYSGEEHEPALSPDGSQVAFSWNGEKQDNFDIYVRLVEGGAALRLTTDPEPDHAPAWSPDGSRLAFFRGIAIYLIPALGGVERRLLQFPRGTFYPGSPSRLSWSPDGKFLAFTGSEDSSPAAIWIVSTDSGEPHRVSSPPNGYQYDISPAFSPDGRTLAFLRARDTYSLAVILQDMNQDGTTQGRMREATGYDRRLQDLTWQADGRGLILTVQQSQEHYGLWRLVLWGTLQPLGIESDDVRWPSVSRTGNRLAYEKRRTDFNIYRMDGPGPDGGPRPYHQCHVTRVVDSTAIDREPMLSPDGRRFAFLSTRSGYNEIHVADASGANQIALTNMGPTAMGSPRWSPDGQTVVFDRYENGHSMIYAVSAEGGKPRRLTDVPASDIRPSFSRDGKWLYFTSNRSGRKEIWKMPSTGGPAQQLTHNSGDEPFESPDGKLLYYAPSPGPGLWSLPTGGGEPRLVLPEARFPLYALAGRSIYYGIPEPASIWVLRLDTGHKFEYVRFPKDAVVFLGGGTAFTVSADERTIMYSQTDRQESDLMLVENFR